MKIKNLFIFTIILTLAFISSCIRSKQQPKPQTAKKSSHIMRISQQQTMIHPQIKFDKTIVSTGSDSVFLMIRFDIPEGEKKDKEARPDLNLGIVMDRSGSMNAKGKMVYAKKAAKYIVDQLQPSDRLAIIEYDDRINILWPSSRVTAKEMIKTRIDTLSPRGSTNLAGGMLRGVQEIYSHFQVEEMTRVILLSDGLANAGITGPEKIKSLVQEAKNRGVTLSTMGLGLNYNEDLMQAIAQTGGGGYYYIEDPTQISRIFQEELSRLFTTIAKDITLKFIGTDRVKKISVYGYNHQINQSEARIELGDFYAGEKRTVLLHLDIESQEPGEFRLGNLDLSFYDNFKKNSQNDRYRIMIKSTTDSEIVKRSENKKVLADAILIQADHSHEMYVKQFEQGKKKIARENISKLQSKLEKLNESLGDVRLVKKIEGLTMEAEELDKAEESAAARQSYLKKNKQAFYLAKQGKRSKYLLQKGSRGYDVEQLQKKLIDLKLFQGKIDGIYSKELMEAVKIFQKKNGLTSDGIAGPATLKKLGLY